MLLNEESLLNKIKANLASFKDKEIKPYMKAKRAIDKAREEYKIEHDYATIEHPFITAIEDNMKAYGKVALNITIGLLLIYYFSAPGSGSITNLFKMIFKNIKPQLILTAFATLGGTAIYYKLRSSLVNESYSPKDLIESLEYHINRIQEGSRPAYGKGAVKGAAIGAPVGAALGYGAAAALRAKKLKTKLIGAGYGAAIGALHGANIGSQAAIEAKDIKKKYNKLKGIK